MSKQAKSVCGALALVLAWLIMAGSLTWQRSRESVIPPVWDQHTYVRKADAFWSGLGNGERKNPLDIEPSVRPPGTILVTAPLGPLKDYRNFYFRSVMIPVVIMVIAIFTAGVGSSAKPWASAAVALLAGSMPMFWQFESDSSTSVYGWGLVDSFLASVAALAMGALLVAAMKSKPFWTGPAVIAIALLPLIKPSGFVVAAMIGFAWVAVGARSIGLHPRGKKRGWIELAAVTCLIVITIGGIALASKESAYLSAENMAFGNEALEQLRKRSLGYSDMISNIGLVISQGIGIMSIGVLAVVGALGAINIKNKPSRRLNNMATWSAKVGGLVLATSLLLCYQATLFLQPRYLFPFIAIVFVLLVPTLVTWCQRAGQIGLASVMGIPFGLLIYLGSPTLAGVAERVGGYGLYISDGKAEVQLAEKLTKKISEEKKGVSNLFHNDTSLNSDLMAFIAGYTYSLEKLGYNATVIADSVKTTLSWRRDPVITIDSVYNSDILALDVNELKNKTMRHSQLSEFAKERDTWMNWLVKTPESGSTTVAMRTPSLLVLLVSNRELLESQMREFMSSRTWREEFMDANVVKSYAAVHLLERPRLNGEQIQQPINVETRLRIHALAFSRMGGAGKVKATVYSERLPSGRLDKLSLFIHELDSENNVVAMHELPLSNSRFHDRPISLDQTTFQPTPKTKLLGVGVYKPGVGSLKTDWVEAKDWNGRRAKLDLNLLPPMESWAR